MTAPSKEAYEKSEQLRWTHHRIILNALKDCELTSREIGLKVRLHYSKVMKRTCELVQDGRVIEAGEKMYGGYRSTIWRLNPDTPLFPVKKLTLRQWLKLNHADILTKYEVLEEHKI